MGRRSRFFTTISSLILILSACTQAIQPTPAPTQLPAAVKPASTSTYPPLTGVCTLAVLLPGNDAENSALQAGLRDAAAAKGCAIEVFGAKNDPTMMATQLDQAIQKKPRAVILQPIDHDAVQQAVQRLQAAGIPVVVLGDAGLSGLQLTRIGPDYADGAGKAADFLCRAVHERGTVLELVDRNIDGDPGQVSKAFDGRFQGICPEAKLITKPVADASAENSLKAMLEVLAGQPDIGGVFAYSESSRAGALKALDESGILGVISAAFGDTRGGSVTDAITSLTQAVIQPAGSALGKAAVTAALNASQAATSTRIGAAMEVHTSDASFQLPPDLTARRITIGVILPDGANPFDQDILRGALTTGRSLDNVTVKVRSARNDPQEMVTDLDWMVKAGVSAILVAPFEDTQVAQAVNRIVDAGMPMVTMGVAIDNKKIISQIRFDEYSAGYKAGERLCSAAGPKGALLDVFASASRYKDSVRTQGLVDFVKDNCSGVTITSKPIGAARGVAIPSGKDQDCKELSDVLAFVGSVAGIFAHSDDLALCAAGLIGAKKTAIIGIGASPEAIEAVRSGKIDATIGQFPYEMGTIAMETTIQSLYGQKVEPDKPFPVNLITKESIP